MPLLACLLASQACHRQAVERQLLITGSDYAFQIPDSIQPGRTVLRFRNAGNVRHELAMGLLKPGVTLDSVLQVMKAGGTPESVIEGTVGILIASPGATALGGLMVDLLPGRTYGFVCDFQDAPDKPPHSALGMVASRRVLLSR